MNKVLYLSYDGLTDPLGQSQILPYLCGLSGDYAITIVSFEKGDRYESEKDLINGICKDNAIQWMPLVYHKSPPVISTLYDLWKLRSISAKLHRIHDFKIVHCRSYITSLVGLWMKKKYRIKFLFDMRGFWADERVDGGLWKISNPFYRSIYRYFKRKERQFLTNADKVISLTHNARNEILKWKLIESDALVIVPCCVDLRQFDPEKITEEQKISVRRELAISEDDFILLYLGSLGTWYQLNEMIDFFVELKERKPNAKFLFVTNDSLHLEESRFASDIIIQKSSRNKVPAYISIADASVMFIKPSFSKKASSATKMAEVLAMRVPIVTNKGWGDVEFYESKLFGLKSVGDKSYHDAIDFIITTTKSIEIRSKVEQYFSLDKGVAVYKEVYKDLIEGR